MIPPIRAVIYRRVACALVLLSLASAAAAKDRVSSIPSVRIDNFGKIDEHYYRGALPVGRDFADLATIGIKTVIDLTSDDGAAEEASLVEQAGMRFVKIPM